MSASAVEVDVARVGLSHSFHVHVPVLAAELTQRAVATQLSGVFLVRGRPVRRVTAVGVVVKVSTGPRFVLFGVDDGSDCLPCIVWLQPGAADVGDESDAGHGAEWPLHGQLLRVRGRLGEYQGQMQVTVSFWERVADANEELLHWTDAVSWAASSGQS